MRPLPDYRPGQKRLSADVETARSRELRAQGNAWVAGGDQSRDGGVPQLVLPEPPDAGFFARLDAEGDPGVYAWTEGRIKEADGTLEANPLGRTGAVGPTVRDPIRELNDAAGLAAGTWVWVLPPASYAPSAAAGENDARRRFVVATAGGGGTPLAGKRDGSLNSYRQTTTDGVATVEYSPQTDLASGLATNMTVPRPTGVSTDPTVPDGTVLLHVPIPDQTGRYWVMPFHPANETYPGWVSVDAQTFKGDKTFLGNVYLAQADGPDVFVGATDGSYTGRITTFGPSTFVEAQGEFGTVTVQPDGSDGFGTGATHNEPGIVLVNGSSETGTVSLVSGATVSADVPAGTVRIVEGVLTGAVRASEFYMQSGGGPGLIYNPFNTGALVHITNPTAGSDYYLGSDGGDPAWVARPATRFTGTVTFSAGGSTLSLTFEDGECTDASVT